MLPMALPHETLLLSPKTDIIRYTNTIVFISNVRKARNWVVCDQRRLDGSSLRLGLATSAFFKRRKKNANTGTVTRSSEIGKAKIEKLTLPLMIEIIPPANDAAAIHNVIVIIPYSTPRVLRTLTTGTGSTGLAPPIRPASAPKVIGSSVVSFDDCSSLKLCVLGSTGGIGLSGSESDEGIGGVVVSGGGVPIVGGVPIDGVEISPKPAGG